MYHLSAFTLLIGNVADTDVPALTDDILTVQNNHFVLQTPMQLLGAAAMSATVTRAKLALPTFRQIANPFIRPVIGAAVPGNNPNLDFRHRYGMRIPPFQELQMLGTSGVAMTERFTGLIWLADQLNAWPQGDVFPLRYTSTTAAVANAWTTVPLTWADSVPPGVYAMLWSEHQSTNGIAHRWVIPNQLWRPGMPSLTALTQRVPYDLYQGVWGLMGSFRSNALPTLQVLANGADAAHEGYLAVTRVGTIA